MTARHEDAGREALARLLVLDLHALREEWCRLYKTDVSPRLSRDLLVRAVAYRMQEQAGSVGSRSATSGKLHKTSRRTAWQK
jgi:hypothetical protein